MHERVTMETNREWRSRQSGYAGPKVMQYVELPDRQHSALELDDND
jgi:hypothetical protein